MDYRYIAYYMIFGKPLIFYMGILALLLVLFAAAIAILNKRKIRWFPFAWHPKVAKVAVAVALLHGIMGLLVYLQVDQDR